MGKEFTKEEIISNKKSAIKALNNMLEGFINNPFGSQLKKANLISFWIKEYVRFINFEEVFDPTKNISYKRGNIIKLNFGFNIGSEYGGLHYGVVLDIKNDHRSPVLTVIPLTSVKENKTLHSNNVELGNELYKLLKLKYDTIYKSLCDEQEEITKMKILLSSFAELSRSSFDELKLYPSDNIAFNKKLVDTGSLIDTATKLQEEWTLKEQHNQEEQLYLKKIGNEISVMKDGSIALINQITTISKIRIFDPRNLKGVLSGISLSENSMQKINEKVKELYVFNS